MAKITIDTKKCTVCGTCVETCPMDVYAKEGDKIAIKKPGECILCRACEVQCPTGAIKVEEDKK